jgi:HlyD family secretion protein
MRRAIKTLVVLGILATAGWFGWRWYDQQNQTAAPVFRTAAVTRDQLLVSIDATGTLEPEEVVDVGARVVGQIVALGSDVRGKSMDYGSLVEEGTVLARIDQALFEADVSQAQAQLQSAEAGVQRAQADLEQLKARLAQAMRDWERAQKIGPSEAMAQVTFDGYQAAYEIARANLTVGEASVLQAKAAVAQGQTNLWRAKRNLGYCTITSPVKGVIIDRRVNIGQTVVASLNTPSLFLIARDLRRMQVWVAVNEADVARIFPGQPVTFTVDALPDETFRGEVLKVRPNASMTQNVVTYTVEITTDNPNGRLIPYLTANVKFEVHRRSNVLLVPNAALRWKPSVVQVKPEFRSADGLPTRHGSSASRPATTRATSAGRPTPGVVYVVDGGYVRPIPVLLGLTNGKVTEVRGEGLTDGVEVVTGVQSSSVATARTSNPFAPKLPRPPGGGPPPR